MKIVHLLSSGLMGGIETHVLTLSLAQKKAGHDVSIVVAQQRGPVSDLMEQEGLRVYYADGKNGHDIAAAFRVRKSLKRIKAEVVHSHGLNLLSWISLGGIKAARISTVHVVGKVKRAIFTRKMLSWINRHAVRFLDGFIAVSSDVKDQFVSAGCFSDCKWQIIFNGIDRSKFYPADNVSLPAKNEDALIELLMVCRMAADKHPDDAIKILAILRNEYGLNVRLTLCGDGTMLPRCRELVNELDVSEFVNIAGRRNDVNELMRKSHGMIFLSDYETFGLSALEGLMSGCPVFCYRVAGGLHEWLKAEGCGGALSDKRTPESLAAKTAAILIDPGLWVEMRRNAIACSAEFTCEAMAEKTGDYYNEVIG